MSSSLKSRRNRLLMVLSAIMFSAALAAGFVQMELAEERADSITVEHGTLLLKQTSLLANPLLLSNDRVSLNYLLNELTTLPYIRAAELKTNREGVIARAGETGGIEMQQALSSKQNSHLSIWLDHTPFVAPLLEQLKTTLIFFVVAVLIALFATTRILHQIPGHDRRRDDARSEPTVQQTAEPDIVTPVPVNEAEEAEPSPEPTKPVSTPAISNLSEEVQDNPPAPERQAAQPDHLAIYNEINAEPQKAEEETPVEANTIESKPLAADEDVPEPDASVVHFTAIAEHPLPEEEPEPAIQVQKAETPPKVSEVEPETLAPPPPAAPVLNTTGVDLQITSQDYQVDHADTAADKKELPRAPQLEDIPFIAELSNTTAPMTPDEVLRVLDAQEGKQEEIVSEAIASKTKAATQKEEGDLQAFISSIATPKDEQPDLSTFNLKPELSAEPEPEPTPEPEFAAPQSSSESTAVDDLSIHADAPAMPDLPADIPYIGQARRPSAAAKAQQETIEEEDARKEPTLETSSLVSLLRPDQNDRSVPAFQPSSPVPEPSSNDVVDDRDILPDLEETDISRDRQPGFADYMAASLKNSGQLSTERGNEEQLNLYTMEHELELMLEAKDAGYCVYIDTSAHAGNVEEAERQQLLRLYTRLAGQTAALYNGNIAELNNGDVLIRFDRALSDDSHGINAVCAAVLFNLLYKGFNQARIRSFQPALNLRMSLARGHRDKEQLLMEEARFLTHTTQSNDLISHTALTEVPVLQEKLLQQADIRRQDEDKVLIMSLSGNIQELLNKQATQLLRNPGQ